MSGDYDQCTGGLHLEGDGFCCLGVAEDKFKEGKDWEVIKSSVLPSRTNSQRWMKLPGGNRDLPSEEFMLSHFGLGSDDWSCLTELNDDGATFEHIADVLTKAYESEDPGEELRRIEQYLRDVWHEETA